MTKEIGALDTQTLDVLLGLTEKAVMHQLLKPRHVLVTAVQLILRKLGCDMGGSNYTEE